MASLIGCFAGLECHFQVRAQAFVCQLCSVRLHGLHRCSRTFGNYLNFVRPACLMGGLSDQVFEEKTAIRRAKVAIDKRGDFVPRPKLWVRLDTLSALAVKLLHMPELAATFAMLLTSYTFHLRRALFHAYLALMLARMWKDAIRMFAYCHRRWQL